MRQDAELLSSKRWNDFLFGGQRSYEKWVAFSRAVLRNDGRPFIPAPSQGWFLWVLGPQEIVEPHDHAGFGGNRTKRVTASVRMAAPMARFIARVDEIYLQAAWSK